MTSSAKSIKTEVVKVTEEEILAVGLALLSEQEPGAGRYGEISYQPSKKTKRRSVIKDKRGRPC